MSQRLSVCMVVRDEEQDLPRCLESVRGLADEIVIVDTGSQDQTVTIAKRFGAIVHESPWHNDFAAARNRSLELASGDWILVLDADEELLPDGRQLLPQLLDDAGTEGYFLTIQNLLGTEIDPQYQCDPVFRLFRRRPGYRFVGAVHEQILSVIQVVSPGAVVGHCPLQIRHYGYLDQYVQAKGKRQRNRRLLEASLAARPDDPYLLFQLGMEQMRASQDRRAAEAFRGAFAGAPLEAPWRPALVKWYGNALIQLARLPAALALLAQGIKEYPDFTDLHYLCGMVNGKLGNWQEAIQRFQTCRERGPAPCPPYSSTEPELGASKADYSLGMALEGAGRYPEAEGAYARAAAARPGWLAPLQRLTRLLGLQGKERELLMTVESHFPGDSEADLVMRSLLLAKAGRYQQALDQVLPMASEGRLSRSAGYVYALTLAKLGRWQEALALCIQEGWQGTAFVPKIRAIILYCQVQLGDKAAIGQMKQDRKGLQALYADLASLLWDEAEASLTRFVRELPRSLLLSELIAKERQPGW